MGFLGGTEIVKCQGHVKCVVVKPRAYLDNLEIGIDIKWAGTEEGFEEGARFHPFESAVLDFEGGVEGPEEEGYGFGEVRYGSVVDGVVGS